MTTEMYLLKREEEEEEEEGEGEEEEEEEGMVTKFIRQCVTVN
jgi:hypothetical protein